MSTICHQPENSFFLFAIGTGIPFLDRHWLWCALGVVAFRTIFSVLIEVGRLAAMQDLVNGWMVSARQYDISTRNYFNYLVNKTYAGDIFTAVVSSLRASLANVGISISLVVPVAIPLSVYTCYPRLPFINEKISDITLASLHLQYADLIALSVSIFCVITIVPTIDRLAALLCNRSHSRMLWIEHIKSETENAYNRRMAEVLSEAVPWTITPGVITPAEPPVSPIPEINNTVASVSEVVEKMAPTPKSPSAPRKRRG